MSLYTWCCQGPCKPSSCATFTLNSHWGRVTQAKKKSCIYVSRVISVVSNSLRLCRLWSTRGLDHGGWFSRQEYWSIFAILVAMPFFGSVQYLGRVQLIANSWTAAHQSFLSITNYQSLLMSTESVMPSNHLILCCPLLLLPSIFPSIRVFSNESALCIRWPKYPSFSCNISPSNEHPRLISFRMDWLDLLAVQGTLKSFL